VALNNIHSITRKIATLVLTNSHSFARAIFQQHQRMELTFHNPGVILGLVSSIVMFWTEVDCWRKRYSDKTTLFLRFKNYTVVFTNWSIVTKYPIMKWHYVDYVFPLSPTRLLHNLTGVIIGAETAYPSGTPEFTRSPILYLCFVDHCLSFCTFSFGHCVVCSSSIYGFWLPL